MGIVWRKLKNKKTLVSKPSKALEYAQKEKRVNPKPYLHKRDENFLHRLRGAHLTEVEGENKPSEQSNLPKKPSDNGHKKLEGKDIPLGKLDIDQITTILSNKSSNPDLWTPEYVSKEFRIRLEYAAGLIKYFNTFVKPPAKKLEPPEDKQMASK